MADEGRTGTGAAGKTDEASGKPTAPQDPLCSEASDDASGSTTNTPMGFDSLFDKLEIADD
jgi:hypothetical protein